MEEKQQKQKLATIMTDIKSGESKKVLKAIKALEKNGDVTVIRPILELIRDGIVPKHEAELTELLCSLKDTTVVVEIMDLTEDPELQEVRHVLLSAIWNMKVDFSNYIDDFVEIATKGTFMEALDCLTIIENLEGPFLEEDLLESQLHLKNYLESNPPRDEQRAHLLSEIALKIKEIDMNLQD
jgi:hypothetical protein